MILTFQTQAAAQTCLDAVNAAIVALRRSQGFTVTADNAIVGKDDNGNDVPTALTTTWDEVTGPSPAATFYFASPNNDASVSAVMASITAANYGWVEQDMPDSWQAAPT